MGNGHDSLLHGGKRGDHHIVLVLPVSVLPFFLGNAHYLKRNFIDPDKTPYRVSICAKQVCDHRLPDHTNFGCAAVVTHGE